MRKSTTCTWNAEKGSIGKKAQENTHCRKSFKPGIYPRENRMFMHKTEQYIYKKISSMSFVTIPTCILVSAHHTWENVSFFWENHTQNPILTKGTAQNATKPYIYTKHTSAKRWKHSKPSFTLLLCWKLKKQKKETREKQALRWSVLGRPIDDVSCRVSQVGPKEDIWRIIGRRDGALVL